MIKKLSASQSMSTTSKARRSTSTSQPEESSRRKARGVSVASAPLCEAAES